MNAPIATPSTTTAAGAAAGAAVRPSTIRYGVLALLALAATGSYLTRICLSTSATTIQREFGISNAAMGEIMAAFFVGYLWFQLPTGWLGARFGNRLTLTVLNVLVSLCSIWSGIAPGPAALWLSRFSLGATQAGLVPCGSRVVYDWFPLAHRGRASSAIASAMSLGAVLASGLTALLLPALGWRGVFFAYSVVGVAWAAAFYAFVRNRPEEHPSVNGEELRLIRGGEGTPGEGKPVPTKPVSGFHASRDVAVAMLTSPSAWLLCGQAFFRAFGAAFFLTWFPAFLEKGHGVKLQDTGLLAMLPLTGSVLGALVGGVAVDSLLRRFGRKMSRSGVSVFALVVAGFSSLAATVAPGAVAMVLILSFGSFCFGMGGPASWAACMDISGRQTQTMMALQNMSGNVGAMVCPMVVGGLFDQIQKGHGEWNQVLYLFAGIYAAGAVCWIFFNPNRSAVERRPAAA